MKDIEKSKWWIGLAGGAGYKDIGPFELEEDARIYAAESGLDRDSIEDKDYEIWCDNITQDDIFSMVMRTRDNLKVWRQLQKDFADTKENEELLFTLNGRQYVLHPASEKDIENHKGWDRDGNFADSE